MVIIKMHFSSTALTEWLRLFSVAALFVTRREHRRLERGLLIVLTIIVMADCPANLVLPQTNPSSRCHQNLQLATGNTAGVPSADPFSPLFESRLDSRPSLLPTGRGATPSPDQTGTTTEVHLPYSNGFASAHSLPRLLTPWRHPIGFVGQSENALPGLVRI